MPRNVNRSPNKMSRLYPVDTKRRGKEKKEYKVFVRESCLTDNRVAMKTRYLLRSPRARL